MPGQQAMTHEIDVQGTVLLSYAVDVKAGL
jgi:hypothetical protein